MHQPIESCRICGNRRLENVLQLGDQYLTGVFPRTSEQAITRGPIELVKCHGDAGDGHCGLVQNRFSFPLSELYGGDYGYRSGLNNGMVAHLGEIVGAVREIARPVSGDLVLDIGSNDGTLLSFYPSEGIERVGMDPTAERFAKYYQPNIRRVPDFFSAARFASVFGDRKAKIVTSVAMFYDLERPIDFMCEIRQVLADDGVWLFEQSYLPAMLDTCGYDAACHEHLEHYALSQIKYMADRAGFILLDATFNDVNGGSIAVIAAKAGGPHEPTNAKIDRILKNERDLGLDALAPYEEFRRKTFAHRDELTALLVKLKAEGRVVLGYGASTKGNVVLQFCGIDRELLPCIAEVNEEKFGCFTPGTHIPIVSEADARAMHPDYFLVLPWHFKSGILQREKAYLQAGGKFIFPLPHLEIVGQ